MELTPRMLRNIAIGLAVVVGMVLVIKFSGGNEELRQPGPTPTNTTPKSDATPRGDDDLLETPGPTAVAPEEQETKLPKATPAKPAGKLKDVDPHDYDPQLRAQEEARVNSHKFIQQLPYQGEDVTVDFGEDGANAGKVSLQVTHSEPRAAAQRTVQELIRRAGDDPSRYDIVYAKR